MSVVKKQDVRNCLHVAERESIMGSEREIIMSVKIIARQPLERGGSLVAYTLPEQTERLLKRAESRGFDTTPVIGDREARIRALVSYLDEPATGKGKALMLSDVEILSHKYGEDAMSAVLSSGKSKHLNHFLCIVLFMLL